MSELPPAVSPRLGAATVNEQTKRHQILIWSAIIAVLCVPLAYFAYTQIAPAGAKGPAADTARHNSATAAVAGSVNTISPADQAASDARTYKDQADRAQQQNVELQQEVAQLKAQQQADRADATHTIKVLSQNMGMHPTGTEAVAGASGTLGNGEVSAQTASPLPPSGEGGSAARLPRSSKLKGVTPASFPVGAEGGVGDAPVAHRTMETVTAGSTPGNAGVQTNTVPAGPNDSGKSAKDAPGAKGSYFTSKLETFDSARFVPPNAYVEAKVLVGVDAATGTSFSADPKPVLFRLISPATHVGIDGKFQTTDLTGCLVNGAAFGELPSEKVYIKLQKITCPAGPGRFSVATVEGFASSKGKAGVRGRVISREGQFTGRAMVAGLLNGLGAGLSKNVQASQGGLTTTVTGAGDLAAHQLSAGQIATGSVGTGVSQAASMLAEYYIKRAEQYQPVIEMPTGIQVELIFLNGFEVK